MELYELEGLGIKVYGLWCRVDSRLPRRFRVPSVCATGQASGVMAQMPLNPKP